MIRSMSDGALRLLSRAEGAATALAVVLAVLTITSGLGLLAAPGWLLWPGLALCVAGWIAGRNADGELLRRDQADDLGHWPRRAEREADEPPIGCGGVHEPTPVDDEGDPVEGDLR